MRAYSLGSPFGKAPCESLQKGHSKEPNARFEGDPIAVWGQLRGAKELLGKSRHFYRLDHAYYGRLDYYRMTRGDFQPSVLVERPADRWEGLRRRYGLKVGPWRNGRHVLVALSDPRTYEFFGVTSWPKEIEERIRRYTQRPVKVRARNEARPIAEDLKDCWCLVTYASNSVVDALLAGVPVITEGPSIARPLSVTLGGIESARCPENREEFFRHVAYSQFTCLEFSSGYARKVADETWDMATASLQAA